MLQKNDWQNLLTNTPETNGCYLFHNSDNHVIYVGKAKNIAKRIKQHFQTAANNSKSQNMINEIDHWETIITNTEKEAFILENNLIKKHFPKFNIILNDDQTYPYIFIPIYSKNPKYFLLWKKVQQIGWYFGPFPNQYSGREILTLLETLFPLRRCRFPRKEKKPCFYYHIGQCLGACFQEIPQKTYQKQLKKVQAFFKGKVEDVKEYYQKNLELAIKNLQFEQADRAKKIIIKIDQWVERQAVEFDNYLNGDFVNFVVKDDVMMIVIFFYRQGKLQLKKEGMFNIFNNSFKETLENFLQAIYSLHPLPQWLFLPQDIELNDFAKFNSIKIAHPQRGQKAEIINLTKKNAEILLQYQGVLPTQWQRQENLKDLRTFLNIQKKIQTLEFLDLSYIDEENIFAGFVHYQNGSPVYRKNQLYKIDLHERNEKKGFEQAIIEHYQKNPIPDLLFVDGGHSQVDGAIIGLKNLNLHTNVFGLVKNDKHQTEAVLTVNKLRLSLNKTSKLWLFLSKIQLDGHKYVNAKRSFWQLKKEFKNSI